MVQFVFSPKWFWGKDIFIDAIGVFVLVLIAVFSTRYYKLNRNKNYLYLALSFYLISFSYLAKILTNFTVYNKVLETATIGLFTITYQKIRVSEILFFIGFFLYRLFALSGFYALYSVHEKQSKLNIFLMLYFMAIATYFSLSPFSYYVFYFASFILLSSITMHYYRRYKRNKISCSELRHNSDKPDFLHVCEFYKTFLCCRGNNTAYRIYYIISSLRDGAKIWKGKEQGLTS